LPSYPNAVFSAALVIAIIQSLLGWTVSARSAAATSAGNSQPFGIFGSLRMVVPRKASLVGLAVGVGVLIADPRPARKAGASVFLANLFIFFLAGMSFFSSLSHKQRTVALLLRLPLNV
jgi:hypothetical protein